MKSHCFSWSFCLSAVLLASSSFTIDYTNFKHFEESRKRKITFEDCTPRLISEFNEFMRNDGNSTGRYNHMPKHQRPREKSLHIRIKVQKKLATFFRWAAKNHGNHSVTIK